MQPKPRERAEARRLRAEGVLLREIADRLGVSLNSAHRWTRDIELTPAQRAQNRSGPSGPWNRQVVDARAETWREKSRKRRREFQLSGRKRARQGDLLHLAGCMLYWAEGGKGRNQVLFANSDVHMVSLFARFLREAMDVPVEDFTIRLNVYLNNGLSLHEIEDHWLAATGAPRSALRQHTIDHFPTSSSGKRPRRLPYGVCTLKVARSTWLVQHIYGAVQEYGDFEEPRWLDGPPRSRRGKKQPPRAGS